MHALDGLAYFARAVSYKCKMFMKLSPGQHHRRLEVSKDPTVAELLQQPGTVSAQ
jgi:hypothetical protein